MCYILLNLLFFLKCHFFTDFKNAVIPQRVDGFLRSTPEMKARDAYVPFLLSKLLNKNEISKLSWDINLKNTNCDFLIIFDVGYLFQFISQENSVISFLFSSLDSRNGTYASLAFISGVGRKNSPTRCGMTSFLKSAKKCLYFKKRGPGPGPVSRGSLVSPELTDLVIRSQLHG